MLPNKKPDFSKPLLPLKFASEHLLHSCSFHCSLGHSSVPLSSPLVSLVFLLETSWSLKSSLKKNFQLLEKLQRLEFEAQFGSYLDPVPLKSTPQPGSHLRPVKHSGYWLELADFLVTHIGIRVGGALLLHGFADGHHLHN